MTRNKLCRRNQSQNTPPHSFHSTAIAAAASKPKSPSDSAMLAQQLASETSWADRYVPATPSDTVMTPSASSVAGLSELRLDEEPPTYESATSEAGRNQPNSVAEDPLDPLQQDAVVPMPPAQPAAQSQPRAYIPDGHYTRHETSSSISGTFTLRDSLDLSTTSGSISIRLDVKPGAHPAILKLKSESGSIRVDDKQCDDAQRWATALAKKTSGSSRSPWWSFGRRSGCESEIEPPPISTSDDPRKQAGQQQQQQDEDFEEEKFVARVIHTTIETSSGSVGGQLLLSAGSETHIKTNSGSIGLRLLTTGSGSNTQTLSKLEQEHAHAAGTAPTGDGRQSAVTTTSGSGSQNVSISTSATDTSGGEIVSALQAKHHTTGSGSLHIDYPRDWTGLVHASIGGSGRCRVTGQGLEYDKRGNAEVYAWRGVDLGTAHVNVEVRSDGSGSTSFGC